MKEQFTTDMTPAEAEHVYDKALGAVLEDGNDITAAQELGSAATSITNAQLKQEVEND